MARDPYGGNFKLARAQAFDRSGGTCQLCGTAQATDAHHWAFVDYPSGEDVRADDLVALCAQCHEVVCSHVLAGRVVDKGPVMGVGRLRGPAQLAGSARTVEGLRSRQLEIPAVWISCHASSSFRLMVVERSLRCRAKPGRASPCRAFFERALNRRRVALRCTFRCRGIYCACCALKGPILVSVAALAVTAAGALLFTTSSSYHRLPEGRKFRTTVHHKTCRIDSSLSKTSCSRVSASSSQQDQLYRQSYRWAVCLHLASQEAVSPSL